MQIEQHAARRSTTAVRGLRAVAAPPIALRVLGDVEAVGPAGTFSAGRSRPGALLAMLAIHAGECVPVDRLVDELWGDEAVPHAGKRVQVNVVRLRRGLLAVAPDSDPTAVVRTHSRGYALHLDPENIDAVRFERLIGRARAELRGGGADVAAATLRDALALWRDEPYADFAYESFAAAEIRRLEELRASALESWAEAELALGSDALMVAELERLVDRYPLRERLRALLMVALYRGRRQADALTAYQAARGALVDGLGIEPGAELRRLQRAILEQCPSLECDLGRWGFAAGAPSWTQVA